MEKELDVNMASEAAIKYRKLVPMAKILGGSVESGISLERPKQLIALTREGIKKSSLSSLAKHLGVTMEVLSGLLQSSYRNIQRKSDDELLDSFKTQKVLELASFVHHGILMLGSKEDFITWLHSDLIILDHKKPVSYLDTSFGIRVLHDILGRIAYGVYS